MSDFANRTAQRDPQSLDAGRARLVAVEDAVRQSGMGAAVRPLGAEVDAGVLCRQATALDRMSAGMGAVLLTGDMVTASRIADRMTVALFLHVLVMEEALSWACRAHGLSEAVFRQRARVHIDLVKLWCRTVFLPVKVGGDPGGFVRDSLNRFNAVRSRLLPAFHAAMGDEAISAAAEAHAASCGLPLDPATAGAHAIVRTLAPAMADRFTIEVDPGEASLPQTAARLNGSGRMLDEGRGAFRDVFLRSWRFAPANLPNTRCRPAVA